MLGSFQDRVSGAALRGEVTPGSAAWRSKIWSAGEALDRLLAFGLRVRVSAMVFISGYTITSGHNMGHDRSTAEIDPGDGGIIIILSYQVKVESAALRH